MLLVDSREKKSVFNILKKLGVDFKITTLPVGDFVDAEKGLVIERKTITDFVSSIRSGHLQKQLLQMNQFDNPYLLISGSLKDLYFSGVRKWTIEHHIGSLVSCVVRYKVKVLCFDNDTQLIKAVVKLVEKTNDGKSVSLEETELLKNNLSVDDVFIKILTGFPGIGVKKAKKLLLNEDVKKLLIILSKKVGYDGRNED